MNYTPEGLIGTFGYYKKHKTKPEKTDGLRKTSQWQGSRFCEAKQEVIANKVYIGPDGNASLGNRILGDGWLYRGRGMKY